MLKKEGAYGDHKQIVVDVCLGSSPRSFKRKIAFGCLDCTEFSHGDYHNKSGAFLRNVGK